MLYHAYPTNTVVSTSCAFCSSNSVAIFVSSSTIDLELVSEELAGSTISSKTPASNHGSTKPSTRSSTHQFRSERCPSGYYSRMRPRARSINE